MSFRQRVKEILVNDQLVKSPSVVTPREIMMLLGKDPERNNLILTNSDGTTDLYPPNALITVRDNAQFETQLSSENGN